MAEYENLTEINENFDTIKTLLNSIRAQGILNTSDVDKLLSGINAKLDKINTDEDIDLIKLFLSELKQNLDERHSVLVSKFGAIEALFSNLLKNSTELPKASDIKELFDIVATNLSVFSREVVSQKDFLSDITLRLDTMRSDDSQKKDIIKNIALLKPDLERLNNGFDSIVISLNDNFKTIVKTISTIDKTEYLDKFGNVLSNIEMSSNTILSALQMLDKKTIQVEDSLKDVATKNDITDAKQKIFDLTAQHHELTAAVSELSGRTARFDSLADKIDASVNIVATLKSTLEEVDDKNLHTIIEKINSLQDDVQNCVAESDFEQFRFSLQKVFSDITQYASSNSQQVAISLEELRRLIDLINSLDISVNFKDLLSSFGKTEAELKQYINSVEQRITTLSDANISRVLNDISASADSLNSRINQTQSEIAVLCEKNFGSVFENISNIKTLLSQIEEDSLSANNAIFSSITDRLTVFEEGLRTSLEAQEKTVNYSSSQIIEQVDNIKNLSSVLDYKIDASVVEIGNVKKEFSMLQNAVEKVLELDFVSVVKDLRVDLYASKQEMMNTIESSDSDLADKFATDLYSKYELLISKIDSLEDEIKKTQTASFFDLKSILENISSSIIDVLSYVSERDNSGSDNYDERFDLVSESIKESSMSVLDGVRDIAEITREKIDTVLSALDEKYSANTDNIKKVISENTEDIRKDIKYSYSKLLEIQDSYSEIKEILSVNNTASNDKLETIVASTNGVKTEFDSKLLSLKNTILDKINEFKQDFTIENADKASEIKSVIENLSSDNLQSVIERVADIKQALFVLSDKNTSQRDETVASLGRKFDELKELLGNLNSNSETTILDRINQLGNDNTKIENLLVDLNAKSDAIVIEKFDSLNDKNTKFKDLVIDLNSKAIASVNEQIKTVNEGYNSIRDLVTDLSDKSENKILNKFVSLNKEFESIRGILEKVDENVDGDMTRQLSIIESNFESLVSQINILFEKSDRDLAQRINEEFTLVSEKVNSAVVEKIDSYKVNLENSFKVLEDKANSQYEYIQGRIANLNSVLKSIWEEQAQENLKQFELIAENLKTIIDGNIEATTADYSELRAKVCDFAEKVESDNQIILENIKKQSNELLEQVNTAFDAYIKTTNANQQDLKVAVNNVSNTVDFKVETLAENLETVANCVERQSELIISVKEALLESLLKELDSTNKNVEKETDAIINEILEQFELLKQTQADDVVKITTSIEGVINDHLYNNIEDLKSYLDVKTDNSVLVSKIDNLKIEVSNSVTDIISDMNKLLDTGVFTSAINDYKLANEVLINSAIDRINDKIEVFFNDNYSIIADAITTNGTSIEDKFAIFNSKLAETIVEKYTEIKSLSNEQVSAFNSVKDSIYVVFDEFKTTRESLENKIETLKSSIEASFEASTSELRQLQAAFDGLRSQISNKSFDEAFQASINKQIAGLEELITEQLRYVEDINELCAVSLPDVTELNTIVKHSILESIKELSNKLDNQDIEGIVERELKQTKSDIITQLLNVFNQISFVSEQEEILDFIQEKHDDLISVLSHIVTTNDEIEQVKDSVSQLNEKINAIISSDGNIDYIYSLQDLESDIANLRLVLNDLKDSSRSEEFSNLARSTEEIYNLVESVKKDLPTRSDFDSLTEDIVSISSRTNKLLLASDESYKTLQDNLQEFKLVINDIDERTRNFAQESGMDRLDAKLNAINSMMQSGAKTNQVFNQVFEYLAEWVDNASVQINSISTKVDSLDDISQIKTMITDMKAQDDIESAELVDALGVVFNKQTKKISTLEKKLDKIIVETTINNKSIDLSPMEDTLNKFLVAMDEKISSQQDKINTLEAKLESVMSLLDDKETAQLTKKVGGMDRQIAKLNKSIEKIASHVIEK